MKHKILFAGFSLASCFVLYCCTKGPGTQPVQTKTLNLPAQTYSYYSNQKLDDISTLGRVLFYDGNLSVNNVIACGSCHKQAAGFADNVPLSLGYANSLTRRNSLPIQDINTEVPTFDYSDSLFNPSSSFFWDGRENNIGNLIMRPVSNHVEMGIADPNTLPSKLSKLPYYTDLFNRAFGSSQITPLRISNAIAVFISAIKTGNSRFDLATRSGGNLTALEQHGEQLFITKYNCNSCHQTLGGNGGYEPTVNFMDNGLAATYTDLGMGALTQNSMDNGKFKAPELRNIALTAPYMHDGRFKTLDEVIDFYSTGIQNSPNLDSRLKDNNGTAAKLNISSADKTALIAFLNTLTDYQITTEPKFSNPFVIQ